MFYVNTKILRKSAQTAMLRITTNTQWVTCQAENFLNNYEGKTGRCDANERVSQGFFKAF